MIKNTVVAQVKFDYKGETYAPKMTIDLDSLMESYGEMPSVYLLLAQAHDIDTYSYQYEIMQDTEISFDNAQGLASTCLDDGVFDLSAFVVKWRDSKLLRLLQPIAQREMGIEDLMQHPQLKSALLHAYNLGSGSTN